MAFAVAAYQAAEPATETHRPDPWWTEADQAELACLLRELVDGTFEHRSACASCEAGYPPCPHVRCAIEVVLDWRQRRELISRAIWLRRQRDSLEYERDLLKVAL